MTDGPDDDTPGYLLPDDTPALTLIVGGKDGGEGGAAEPAPAGKKLTAKQARFADNVVKGMNQSDAYREAYDAENMTDKTIWEKASWLASQDKVRARIERGKARIEGAALHTGLSLRLHVERRLFDLSKAADTDAACIRATELLGKLTSVQAFKDVIGIEEENVSPDEVRATLEERIRSAFSDT